MDCQHNIRTKLDGHGIGFDRCEECGAHIMRGSINGEEVVSREIKFRAWDRQAKYMMSWREVLDCIQDIGAKRFFDNNRFLKLQYIGLKDKRGNEIYEGDVYQYGSGQIYICTFINGCFTGQEPDQGDFEIAPINNDFCEVIGNIYENPEVLKK